MIINSYVMTDNNSNTPMGVNPYKNATSAYGIRQDANMSGFEVTAKLYEGMIRFIGQAKNSYKIGRLDDMVATIQKVNKILIALQSNLNFEGKANDAAVFLNDLYMEVFKRLTFILRAEDTEKEFDEVHALLAPVAKMWADHAENAKKAVPEASIKAPEVPFKSE